MKVGGMKVEHEERRVNGAMEEGRGSRCLITVSYNSQKYFAIAVLFPRQDPVNAAK